MSEKCANCGKDATCYGAYEQMPADFACDECCGHGHGNEDGWCVPLTRDNRNLVNRLTAGFTLTVEEIRDLALFAGLRLVDEGIPQDEKDAEITVAPCPNQGVKDDDGQVLHSRFIAYWDEYPDEGVFPLGGAK